jgi:hypothetical protein
MSEVIRPQLTLNPEGELKITTGLGEGFERDIYTQEMIGKVVEKRREHLAHFSEKDGISVEEENGVASVSVDVRKSLGKSFNFFETDDSEITDFLADINGIVPVLPLDSVDRVLALRYVSERGADGAVNQQFQRWLNAQRVTEDVARQCVSAMSMPYGETEEEKAKKEFEFRSGDGFAQVNTFTYKLNVATGDFGLYRLEDTEEGHEETEGKVAWSWFHIATLGSCACWGVPGDDREHVELRSDTKALYEMEPHNVDSARQSLSLILGVGALAHHAALYEGTEDVFAKTEWGVPRLYPKR